MLVRIEAYDVSKVQLELTVRMPLDEWLALRSQLDESRFADIWPLYQFRRAVIDVIDHAQKHWTERAEKAT